jgi:hypothetical protein
MRVTYEPGSREKRRGSLREDRGKHKSFLLGPVSSWTIEERSFKS